MSAYVIDSSVFASIIVKDKFYERASSFLKECLNKRSLTVDLSIVETANTLWKHVYLLRRIPVEKLDELRRSIVPLILGASHVIPSIEVIEDAVDKAAELGITVYDSVYIALAARENCMLATFDEDLVKLLEKKGLNIAFMP